MQERQEQEADEFAAYFLMPEEELQKLKGKGIEEHAKYFGVPEEIFRKRLTLFWANTNSDSQHL